MAKTHRKQRRSKNAVIEKEKGVFLLPKFRLNHAYVCKRIPEDAEIDAGRFTVQAIWDEDDTDIDSIRGILDRCAKDAGFKAGWKNPLRDGEEKEGQDGYGEGKYFARLVSYYEPPRVFDGYKDPITDDKVLIHGSYAKSIVTLFPWTKKDDKGTVVSRGVSMCLETLQWLGGGKQFAPTSQKGRYADDYMEAEDMEDTEPFDDIDDEDDETEAF